MNVQECYSGLKSWNLEPVRKYLMAKEGIEAMDAEELEDEYRKFLALASESKGGDPPSAEVDKFWHAHILHSRDYVGMCNEIFGRYIHHQPSEESEETIGFWTEMLGRYRKYFGEPGRMWTQSGCCRECNVLVCYTR